MGERSGDGRLGGGQAEPAPSRTVLERLIDEAELAALQCPCDTGCNHCFAARAFLALTTR